MRIEQVVEKHLKSVYGYCYRLAGSHVDAEDLLQQVFLQAQQKLDQLKDEKALKGWLFSIARNCFLNQIRDWKRHEKITESVNWNEVVAPSNYGDEIDSELIQLALDQLDVQHRIVLVMFYFEDLSYREIADELEIALGTVMSRLSRAKQKFREEILSRNHPESAPLMTADALSTIAR